MSRVSYNWLGQSGLRASNICLGTMNFGKHEGGRPSCNQDDAHAILDHYAEAGGNFIDVADVYQAGDAETIIGNWLIKQKRERFIIATKCGRIWDKTDPNSVGLSRKHILESIDGSLKRLQTDYVDIFFTHVWHDRTPLEETLSALNDLVREGKVRYLGVSNVKGWQLQKIVDICKYNHWQPVICLQQQYSILCRSTEFELTDVCKTEGVGLLPWSPLKGGWLSGKIQAGSTGAVPGSRMEWARGRAHHSHPDFDWFKNNKQVWSILAMLEELAKKHDRSVPQIAVRWLLQKPTVPSVVIGPRTISHLQDIVSAASPDWHLSTDEMKLLDDVSTIPQPYPYDYIELFNKECQ
ncbi:hypothetical protein LSH36_19g04003 [Paralvinella palmiformis]|uniref:NADP-dependent oxidoreductase domain-containing protein n=1 Tax=Paralvinella palmiformis TaxID=53620 RepID=A0AAD9KBG7_9ANNE|nr:hypothetical protein LSH36_19g04003 [Paralvinella palmiformis]